MYTVNSKKTVGNRPKVYATAPKDAWVKFTEADKYIQLLKVKRPETLRWKAVCMVYVFAMN